MLWARCPALGAVVLDLIELLFKDRGRYETRWERPRRKILEGHDEGADVVHRAVDLPDMVELPVPECVRGDVGPLERILKQVEYLLEA